MELRVLRYFLAVAQEQSITGAAEVLHVTQPTLSRQLMELEEELGKKLFVRGSRKVTLTEEGLYLRKRAQEIVDLVSKTESDFNMPDEFISGDVFIGGGETDAMRLIAKAIKKMQEAFPMVRYHLYSGNAQDVTEKLDNGLLDFCVLIDPVDIKKYDYLKLPAVDTWGILMRKDSVLATLDAIKPADLWDIPLICSRQMLEGNVLSGWLGTDNEKLNIVATYNLIFNAGLMVQEGIGYTLGLDKLVNTTGNSMLKFTPLEPLLEANLYIAWKKHQIFSQASKKFLEQIQQALSFTA